MSAPRNARPENIQKQREDEREIEKEDRSAGIVTHHSSIIHLI
jgi:hypothetical protein